MKPSENFSDMPRHPVEVDPPEACMGCGRDYGDPLECDKCDGPWHLECLNPPLSAVPEGEWFCPECDEPGAPVGSFAKPKKGRGRGRSGAGVAAAAAAGGGGGVKRGREHEEDEDDDGDGEYDDDDEFEGFNVQNGKGNREFVHAVVVSD